MATSTVAQHWLSQAEAAEYLGLKPRTIRHYIAAGILPASRVRGTRTVRINRDDLVDLMRPIPSAKSGGGADA